MKIRYISFALLISYQQFGYADETVVMSNGMTCFRNNSGFTYGCSGGAPISGGGVNDVRTGERYNSINSNQAVGQQGQVIDVPQNESYEEMRQRHEDEERERIEVNADIAETVESSESSYDASSNTTCIDPPESELEEQLQQIDDAFGSNQKSREHPGNWMKARQAAINSFNQRKYSCLSK